MGGRKDGIIGVKAVFSPIIISSLRFESNRVGGWVV